MTTSRVISKESENVVRRIFCNSLDNIINIMSYPCVAPVRDLQSLPWPSAWPANRCPVRDRPIAFCEHSYSNLQINSIMPDSDMHWFQFLRLTDQENIYTPGMKNRKILSKMLFFATSTDFRCKRHFYKRVTNASLHWFCRLFVPWLWIEIYWRDFYVADTYTRGDDSVIIYPKVNALS